MDVAIETDQLTKTFAEPRRWRRLRRPRPVAAVQDVSLSIYKGEVFGLLGPNGAGKTTLVKTLCTLIRPTSGTAVVAGYPLTQPQAIRAAVGLVVSDERSFYWRLTGRQNLKFFAQMYRLYGAAADGRVDQVLAEVDLLPYADRRFSDYSSGVRQRLAIARSLLHHPHLLFLDEPSRSLDPTATQRLHDLIRQLVEKRGVTVFLTTHDLTEAERLCRRVAIMHQGRVRIAGSLSDLRRQLQPQLDYTVRLDRLPLIAEQHLSNLAPDSRHERDDGQARIYFRAGEDDSKLMAVLDCLRQHQLHIFSIEGHHLSLEEVFNHYTRDDVP